MELPQSYISLLNCFWCGFMLKSRCALINFWLKAGPHGKWLSILTQRISALSLILWINPLLSNVECSELVLGVFLLCCFFFFWHSKLMIVCILVQVVRLLYVLDWLGLCIFSPYCTTYPWNHTDLELALSKSHHLVLLPFWGLQCSSFLRWWIYVVTINIQSFHGPFSIMLSAICADTDTPKEFLCANGSFSV